MSGVPVRRVAGFVRRLRDEGFGIGVGESVDALRIVQWCELDDVATVRDALRGLVCHNRAEWRRFDPLFNSYWLPNLARPAEHGVSAAALVDPRLQRRRSGYTGLAHADTRDSMWEDVEGAGAGRHRTLTRTDYRFLTDRRGRREIEYLAERLALGLRKRFARRRRISKRGRRIHLRRTLRTSLSAGGLPVHCRYVVRHRIPPKLVLIQDISHSMAPYNPLFTRFIRGLLRVFRDAEAYAFHTELYPITHWYREKDDAALRQRLEGMSHLWMGGTRIAHSLARFMDRHGRRALTTKSVVMILSDGYDTDESEQLYGTLRTIRERVRQLIWLNPAMEADEIADPEWAELRPHTDHLLPAKTLEALARAVELIALRG